MADPAPLPPDGSSYASLVKTSALVNFFYFYCVDADFGPFFISSARTSPIPPSCASTAMSGPSGRPPGPGSASRPWTTGSPRARTRRAAGPLRPARPADIGALLDKWLRILPHPFTADDIAAGYRYELSILQAEFSLTQVLDAPAAGRIFFEQVIRDNLDIGRPDQVALVFARRLVRKGRFATPGRFRTRVITRGRPEPAHRLQAHQDQAVPQARPGAPHRDHHQRRSRRLRHPQAADQPAGGNPLEAWTLPVSGFL